MASKRHVHVAMTNFRKIEVGLSTRTPNFNFFEIGLGRLAVNTPLRSYCYCLQRALSQPPRLFAKTVLVVRGNNSVCAREQDRFQTKSSQALLRKWNFDFINLFSATCRRYSTRVIRSLRAACGPSATMCRNLMRAVGVWQEPAVCRWRARKEKVLFSKN